MQTAPQPDEVVEVFTGDTLEEAMAYAVAALGPDLSVRRARRVRKGVQGLRGKERYEVLAVPAPRAAGSDAVGSAFEALLHQAERAEEIDPIPVRRTARPAHADAVPVILEAVPRPRAESELFDQTLLAPIAAKPPVAKPIVSTPPPRRPVAARPAAPPAPRRTPEGSGWSRKGLAALGLPRTILAELPERDPRGDLAWVRALTRALATVVPPYDEDAAVVASGIGVDGVLGILAAARKGMAPGTITYDGRTAPATATELALAIRSEVLR